MYIRCKGCGHILFLAKVFGFEYATLWDDMSDRLDAFFNIHASCSKTLGSCERQDFELVFESADDFSLDLDDKELVDEEVERINRRKEEGERINTIVDEYIRNKAK